MWYTDGTVSVTLNSNAVVGAGTDFNSNARVGDAFRGPDGAFYEITNIPSSTALTIRPNYAGATGANQAYSIVPIQGYVKDSADKLRQVSLSLSSASIIGESLVTRDYTSAELFGTKTQEEVRLLVDPTANSTAVSLASRFTTTVDTDLTLPTGSSVGAIQAVVNAAGTGFVDKLVGILSHLNFSGTGRKASALCFEAGIPTVPADSDIGSVCGFYFPNMAGIPNIDRISTLAAFANQHRKAIIQNMGLYLDSLLRQVVPPNHPGLAVGRYYTAPYRWVGYSGFQVGQTMLMPIYIPARTRIGFMGVGINSAVADAKCRIALYSGTGGEVKALIGQTAEFDVSSVGAKEGTCDFEVDGGFYWMGVMCSAAVQISTHAPQDTGTRAAMFGQSNPLANDDGTLRSAFINLPYIPFPAEGNLVPNYNSNDSEVHAWLRRL